MEERAASRRIIRWIATVLSFALVASGLGIIGGNEASAAPLAGKPFQAPSAGLDYALDKRAGLWKDAWFARGDDEKPWALETYDPKYVNPTSFGSVFTTQCVDATDWDKDVNQHLATVNTYRWTVDGVLQKSPRSCASTRLALNGEGIHDVKLQVVRPNGTSLLTRTRTVLVQDKVVVLLGDSAASGEGSPEKNRTGDQEFGTWIDRRCHRSSQAAIPRAVMQMEDADPYTTITFLNFACSGATIERDIPEEGSGVLGRYIGIEHDFYNVHKEQPSTWLPAQVDQLDTALSRQARYQPEGAEPLRAVDKLFISGGINDLKFSKLASACVVFDHCVNKTISLYNETDSVANTLQSYADAIPASFGKVDQALLSRDIVTDERYAMQYPDAFSKSSNGALCTEMLEDVIPMASAIFLTTVLTALLVILHIFAPPVAAVIDAVVGVAAAALFALTGIDLYTTLASAVSGGLHWASDEIFWMKTKAMPALDQAVRDGADAGNFTFVDHIAEKFAGHGYCAADNWIVRAKQATFRQGPFNFVSRPLGLYYDHGWHFGGLGLNMQTKGLMHPTPAGYEAAKKAIVATNVKRDGRTEPLFEDFRNHAPVAVNNAYTLDVNEDLSLDTGFFGLGVLANDKDVDGDELRTHLVSGPNHGSAYLSNGRLIYTPTPGYVGTDTVTYRATDGGLESNTATITITVTKPPVAPGFAWTFPTNPKPSDFLDAVGTDFPLCRNCSDLVIQTAATYTATTNESHELVDSFDVVAGQMVNGTFQELYRATVKVTVPEYLH